MLHNERMMIEKIMEVLDNEDCEDLWAELDNLMDDDEVESLAPDLGVEDLRQARRIFGLTDAGNYRHPSYPDCLKWVKSCWDELDTAGVVKKAQELGMTPGLGPEVEGYVDQVFEDLAPSGENVIVRDAELERDLAESWEALDCFEIQEFWITLKSNKQVFC